MDDSSGEDTEGVDDVVGVGFAGCSDAVLCLSPVVAATGRVKTMSDSKTMDVLIRFPVRVQSNKI